MDLFSAGGGNTDQAILSSKKDLSNTPHHYQFVNTALGIDLLVQKLLQQPSVCFDTETTNLNALTAELVGIAFSWEVGTGYYVSVPQEAEKAAAIIDQLRPFFENSQIEKLDITSNMI